MELIMSETKLTDAEPITTRKKKPEWLRVKLPTGPEYAQVRKLVEEHKLHTICESGNCPNMGECWGAGTATFMILGNVCTRSCGFCAVSTGMPSAVDWQEPARVANSVKLMGVKHAVVTSVDRDDLKDGGSIIWVETIQAISSTLNPTLQIEGILRTMYDPRSRLTIEVSNQLYTHFGDRVYRTVVPRNIRLAEAPSYGMPVLQYDRQSKGAIAYLALAGEMIRRIEQAQQIA